MRRLWILALAALLPLTASAQVAVERSTLMSAYDLDGEAADDNQIVTSADLDDSNTYTIAAQPDVCRLVDITVTDANSSISAGTITVEGTGCLSEARSCAFTFASGGSGVKTLTCTDGQGAYFANVASVITSALTGEDAGPGTDLVIVGYTSNSVNGWAMYGKLIPRGPMGEGAVDPFGYFDVNRPITTSGTSSTTVTSVGSASSFELVAVGDLLIIPVQGRSYERKVTARASANSITVSSALTIPTAGVNFRFKKMYYSTNPADVMVIPVHGFKTLLLDWSVDANVNTGGVVTLLECTQDRVEFPGARWVELDTTTVASAGTQANTSESVDLTLLPYLFCRFGLRFGTGDDGDGAAEDINASFSLMR